MKSLAHCGKGSKGDCTKKCFDLCTDQYNVKLQGIKGIQHILSARSYTGKASFRVCRVQMSLSTKAGTLKERLFILTGSKQLKKRPGTQKIESNDWQQDSV